jgi:hypothetical protein
MKGWLKAAWHDPVGSKVIAGIILFALGGLATLIGVLWSKSDFNTNAAVAWTAAKQALLAYSNWVNAPATMSRGTVFTMVCAAFIVPSIILIAVVRRLLGSVRLPVVESVPQQRSPAVVAVEPTPPPPSELTEKQRRLLHIVCSEYPRSVNIHIAMGPLSLFFPAMERLCEGLETMKLVQIITGGHGVPFVLLTKRGRDYCLDHGLDDPRTLSAS